MAYLEIDEAGYVSTAPTIRAPIPTKIYTFSALEWTVVSVARLDALRWTTRFHIAGPLLRMLLGVHDNRLANPRLEALRHTALVLRRRGARLSRVVAATFDAAGFTREQLTTLIQSVEFDIVSRRQGSLA